MKLKVSALLAAYPVITAIVSEKRALPQKGQYRVARMHSQLAVEYAAAKEQADGIVRQFGVTHTDESGAVTKWTTSPDMPQWAEFQEAFVKLGEDEIEVAVQPIPLDSLGDVGSITAAEFIALGDLVAE